MSNTKAAQTLARLVQGQLADEELQAGFLAARQHGKILDDDVLAAIVRAVAEAASQSKLAAK